MTSTENSQCCYLSAIIGYNGTYLNMYKKTFSSKSSGMRLSSRLPSIEKQA